MSIKLLAANGMLLCWTQASPTVGASLDRDILSTKRSGDCPGELVVLTLFLFCLDTHYLPR